MCRTAKKESWIPGPDTSVTSTKAEVSVATCYSNVHTLRQCKVIAMLNVYNVQSCVIKCAPYCPWSMNIERLGVTRHEMKESVFQYTRNLQPNRSHLSKFNSSLFYAR